MSAVVLAAAFAVTFGGLCAALKAVDRPCPVRPVPPRRAVASVTWDGPGPVDPEAEWNDPEHPDSAPDGDPVPVPDGPDHTTPAHGEAAAHG